MSQYKVKPFSLVSLESAIIVNESENEFTVETPGPEHDGKPMTAVMCVEDRKTGQIHDWAVDPMSARALCFTFMQLLAANGDPVARKALFSVAGDLEAEDYGQDSG